MQIYSDELGFLIFSSCDIYNLQFIFDFSNFAEGNNSPARLASPVNINPDFGRSFLGTNVITLVFDILVNAHNLAIFGLTHFVGLHQKFTHVFDKWNGVPSTLNYFCLN
jgi:hypothetical protein